MDKMHSLGQIVEQEKQALWIDACGDLYDSTGLFNRLMDAQRAVAVTWREVSTESGIFPALVDHLHRPWIVRLGTTDTSRLPPERRHERHLQIAAAMQMAIGNGAARSTEECMIGHPCFPDVPLREALSSPGRSST